mmetsp:Transcript_1222/g.2714  ORF Transcript_1222/g.2714 Transcript_1222/m.2714 type:complete len:114 (+) Transcript_1222:1607-1948(+)
MAIAESVNLLQGSQARVLGALFTGVDAVESDEADHRSLELQEEADDDPVVAEEDEEDEVLELGAVVEDEEDEEVVAELAVTGLPAGATLVTLGGTSALAFSHGAISLGALFTR